MTADALSPDFAFGLFTPALLGRRSPLVGVEALSACEREVAAVVPADAGIGTARGDVGVTAMTTTSSCRVSHRVLELRVMESVGVTKTPCQAAWLDGRSQRSPVQS